MTRNIRLSPEDPTVFAKCPKCDRHGRGEPFGNYFGKTFSIRQWRRGQVCDNCGSALLEIRRIKLED
jgi:hypothetical protein